MKNFIEFMSKQKAIVSLSLRTIAGFNAITDAMPHYYGATVKDVRYSDNYMGNAISSN